MDSNHHHIASICCFDLAGHKISDSQLHQDIAKLQQRLTALQLTPTNTQIAICCHDSYWFTVALRSLIGLQYQIVLLPNMQTDTLQRFARHYQLVISDLEISNNEQFTTGGQALLVVNQHSGDTQITATLDWYDTQITLYTSGSSGAPKAVVKYLAQLLAEIDTLDSLFGKALSKSIVASVSHQHIYGILFKILWPQRTRRAFCRELIEFQEQLQVIPAKPFSLISSPAFLSHLQNLDAEINPPTCLFSSGGPLSLTAASNAQQILHTAVTEILGSTETGGIAWRQQLQNTAWQPLPKVNISLNAQQSLVVESPFSGGSQSTGDSVEILANGHFIHLGRADRIVKIAEKRLSLVELETFAQQSALVANAFALVISKDSRVCVALVVELNDMGNKHLEQQGKRAVNQVINLHLQQRFERVTLPRYFRYCKQLPLNAQGKLILANLESLFSEAC